MYEFPVTGTIEAEFRLAGGRIETTTQNGLTTATVTVEPMDGSDASREAAERTTVEMHGTRLTVKAPEIETTGWLRGGRSAKIMVTAALPAGSSMELRSASADATLHGVYGAVAVHTASGDAFVETVTGDLTVQAASGDTNAGHVGGDLKVDSASGDLHAEQVDGTVVVHTASGDVEVGAVGNGAKANTASGDITITKLIHGHAKINSASGDIEVGVGTGTGVYMDIVSMSGRARSDLDTSPAPVNGNNPEVTLHLRSMSGDITVKRS
jgi:DUF4097 and DUF4098 domain-containing protein YvlB